MSNEKTLENMSFTTRSIHVGNEADPATVSVEPAIYIAISFQLP